jgi:FkbM family methyltransferase
LSNTRSSSRNLLRSARNFTLRLSALNRRRDMAPDTEDFFDGEQSAQDSNPARRKKLNAASKILGCSPGEAAQVIYNAALAGMPNNPLRAYLLPDLKLKSCERVSEELLRAELANGRVFYGHRSNGKEYLLHQAFQKYLPEIATGDAYKLLLDIQRRYLGGDLPWYMKKGGVYIEGGCFTGMKAIHWYDSSHKPHRILAVEIGQTNSEILKANIVENGLGDAITPVHAGLWSETGEGVQKHSFSTRRFLEATDRWESSMLNEEAVALLTIDDLLDRHEVDVADFLNIQVNGAEIQVLKGFNRTRDRVKVISVAAYYTQDGVKNADVVREQLLSFGCHIIHETPIGRITAAMPAFRDEVLSWPGAPKPAVRA